MAPTIKYVLSTLSRFKRSVTKLSKQSLPRGAQQLIKKSTPQYKTHEQFIQDIASQEVVWVSDSDSD